MKTYNFNLKNNDILETIDFTTFKKEKNVLVQVFSGQTQEKFQRIINIIQIELPHAICIGATSDGEIEASIIHQDSSVISISIFKHTLIKGSYVTSKSSYDKGVELAQNIITDNTKLLILFASVEESNCDKFLEGIASVNKNIMICGGVASTNSIFDNIYISFGNQLIHNGMVGVSLNSDILKVTNDFRYNWMPIGIEHTITEVKDNRVFSIDDMNPLKFYEKYLGKDMVDSLPQNGQQFPLLILKNDIPIGRVVIQKDEDSITFNGHFKKGDIVKFSFGQADIIMSDAYASFQNVFKHHSESFFIYSCMARRRFLPEDIHLEIEPFSTIAPTSGFFTHGEFFHQNKTNIFLNTTLTVVSLTESNKEPNPYQPKKNIQPKYSEQTKTIKILTNLIEQSSKDYYKLNDELEQRVKERTLELENLTATLQHKVDEAVAQNKKKDKLLFEQSKMSQMGELMSNIAHQWRQPLSVITTAASGIKLYNELGTLKTKDVDDFADGIISNANYLSSTINEFRQYTRGSEKYKEVTIQDRLSEALQIIEESFQKDNISIIKKEVCEEEIKINVILGELLEVLLVIFTNARDAFKNKSISNKWVKYSLTKNKKFFTIMIEDNAGGIPEDIIEKIFTPYFTTKHQGQGTGIGLYLSYEIVVNHLAGKIYAKNSNDGAQFFIELPIKNPSDYSI